MTRINTAERKSPWPRTAAFLLAAALLAPAAGLGEENLLKLLGIAVSAESIDYVVQKTPFQLHTLLTEQRHPKTWMLGRRIAADTAEGLRMLFGVDEDIALKLDGIVRDPEQLGRVEGLTEAFAEAMFGRRKIYVYGCGATGRLAKQVESAFWRPFWTSLKKTSRASGRNAPPVSIRPLKTG